MGAYSGQFHQIGVAVEVAWSRHETEGSLRTPLEAVRGGLAVVDHIQVGELHWT